MVYLVAEVTGVILFAAIYYTLDALIRFPFADRIMTSVSIAFVNTVFRFIKVVALLPFTKQIEKTVNFLVRDKPQQKEVEPEAMRLEERFIQHPALAIEQSRLTINAGRGGQAEFCQRQLRCCMAIPTNSSSWLRIWRTL